MATRLETILAALATALGATGVPVKRNDPVPETVGPDSLIILRDGEAGEPLVTMSPLAYEYQHLAEVEVYVQRKIGREGLIDALKAQIGSIVTADRTLGGLCDWIEATAPQAAAFTIDGAAPMLSHRIEIMIVYVTLDPLA
jgi:hypothetical protein